MRLLAISVAVLALIVVAPPAPAATPTYDRPIVVGEIAIKRTVLRHWERIAERQSGNRAQVVVMLVQARWIFGEADRRGVVVTAADVERAYRKIKRSAYPSEAKFRRFLRRSGQTRQDLRFRVRMDLTSERLQEVATAGLETDEEKQGALDAFVTEFRAHWLPLTQCSQAYHVKTVCASASGSPAQSGW